MLKPNSTFKLPKYVKRRMATITDNNERHEYKRMMIQAILQGEQVVVPKEKKNRNKPHEVEVE
jgi:hypothetical protein